MISNACRRTRHRASLGRHVQTISCYGTPSFLAPVSIAWFTRDVSSSRALRQPCFLPMVLTLFYPIFLPVDATPSPATIPPFTPRQRNLYCCCFPRNSNVADTPFEDGTFKLCLTFDETYPNKPPTVKFISKMFHPNVYANGELCLDILQNRWSPTYDVAAILTSIQSLLHDPNPNRCVPPRATRLLLTEFDIRCPLSWGTSPSTQPGQRRSCSTLSREHEGIHPPGQGNR